MDRKENCIKERNREGEKIDLFLNVTEGDRRRERERVRETKTVFWEWAKEMGGGEQE